MLLHDWVFLLRYWCSRPLQYVHVSLTYPALLTGNIRSEDIDSEACISVFIIRTNSRFFRQIKPYQCDAAPYHLAYIYPRVPVSVSIDPLKFLKVNWTNSIDQVVTVMSKTSNPLRQNGNVRENVSYPASSADCIRSVRSYRSHERSET